MGNRLEFLLPSQNITVCDERPSSLCTFSGCVWGGSSRDKSFLGGDNLEASELINGELSGSESFYYGDVRDRDDLASERLLVPNRLLEEGECRICLNRIFTTGPPQEEAGMYYSRGLPIIPILLLQM